MLIAAGAPGEDVARGIDPWLESGAPHQFHDVFAPLNICVRIRDAADTAGKRATIRPPEDTELLEAPSQRRAIHPRRPPLNEPRAQRGSRAKGCDKRAAGHTSHDSLITPLATPRLAKPWQAIARRHVGSRKHVVASCNGCPTIRCWPISSSPTPLPWLSSSRSPACGFRASSH